MSIEDRVGVIVASHWHDDHVRGLGRLVEQARAADVSCANVFARNEFVQYVQTIGKGSLATDGGKVSEIRKVFGVLQQRGGIARRATAGRVLKIWHPGGDGSARCELTSLSPSDRDLELFFEAVARQIPTLIETKRSATALEPNLTGVVLHLKMPRFSALLCADMEVIADEARGWRAVLSEAQRLDLQPASVVKVAHHGSPNGHSEDAWMRMILPRPIGVVTPFNKQPAERKLPRDDDLLRLSAATSRLLLTAPRTGRAARRDRDATVLRSLRESGITMRDLDLPIGMVRLRRRFEADEWAAEVFPPAHEVDCTAVAPR